MIKRLEDNYYCTEIKIFKLLFERRFHIYLLLKNSNLIITVPNVLNLRE